MPAVKTNGADIEFGNSLISQANITGAVTSYQACALMLAEAPGISPGASAYPSAVASAAALGSSRDGDNVDNSYCGGSDYGFSGWGGSTWLPGGSAVYYGSHLNVPTAGRAGNAATVQNGNIQDYGRHWSAYCLYGDMGHTEGCPPECISAYDHVALIHGLYNIVETMMHKANARLPEGYELFVTANNTDGTPETSWGGHVNMSIERTLFRAIFERRPLTLGFLASFLAATSVVFGQGDVVRYSRNGRRHKGKYVLSSRARHTGMLLDSSTTRAFRRPLVNSRDESHARGNLARLHLICYDTLLQQPGLLCRTWLLQAFLAAMECGYCSPALILEDPVAAVHKWSSGFSPLTGRVEKRCRLAMGGSISLVELLSGFTEGIERYIEDGDIPGEIVPDSDTILPLWKDMLCRLECGDVDALSRCLDFALKFKVIDREMSRNNLALNSDEVALINLMYSHLDKQTGLYWPFLNNGYAVRCVSEEKVHILQQDGPENTRAWTRTAILKKFPEAVSAVNWSRITLKVRDRHGITRQKYIHLDDPAGHTREQTEALIAPSDTVEALCDALDAADTGMVVHGTSGITEMTKYL